jgi:hypothetical protein
MARRPVRFSIAEWRRLVAAAKDAGVIVEIGPDDTVRLLPPQDLPAYGRARNASGYVEAKIAAAPWVKLR